MGTTLKQDQEFAKEMISLDNTLDWIRRNLSPEDVFTAQELWDWATNNGWTEGE